MSVKFMPASWWRARILTPPSPVALWAGKRRKGVHKAPKLSPEARQNIKARRALLRSLATKTNERGRRLFGSTFELQQELLRQGFTVHRSTVHRDLNILGFNCRVRPRVPTVYEGDKEKRLEFARRHVHTDPGLLIFSDEKMWTTNDHGHRTEWNPDGVKPSRREFARFPKGRVMVWGAIGINFRHLVIVAPGTTLNADGCIRRCLSGKLVNHVVGNGLTFQQDGARIHTCTRTTAYLNRQGVNVLAPWPPRSPCLNPIESLWAYLNRRVSTHAPASTDELIAAIHAEWDAMPTDMVNRFVRNFTTQCQAVVDAGGDHV